MMKDKTAISYMRVLIKMVDPVCIEQRTTAFNAVDFITFVEKKFCQV